MTTENIYRVIYVKRFKKSDDTETTKSVLESLTDKKYNSLQTYIVINDTTTKTKIFNMKNVNIKTVEQIKDQESITLKKVFSKRNIQDIIRGGEHFDWWMFPIREEYYMGSQSSGTSTAYLVNDTEIEYLLNDSEFMQNYILSIQIMNELYKKDWEELGNKQLYEVRLAKMLHSLYDFIDISNKTDSSFRAINDEGGEETMELKKEAQNIIKLLKTNKITLNSKISKNALKQLKYAIAK